MSESEIIDKLLVFYALREGGYPVDTTGEMRVPHMNARNKMIAYRLIEKRSTIPNQDFYFLTETGYQAYQAGGFEKWQNYNQRKADELHQATIVTAKATVDAAKSAKLSKYAAYVSAAAAIIALLYPTLFSNEQKTQSKSTDYPSKSKNTRIDTMSKKLKGQLRYQQSHQRKQINQI